MPSHVSAALSAGSCNIAINLFDVSLFRAARARNAQCRRNELAGIEL
jgi:hypothetical protein